MGESFITKVKHWFMQLVGKPPREQPTVTEEEEAPSLHICVSDIGQKFQETGGYQYHSHIPNSSKDTDKT